VNRQASGEVPEVVLLLTPVFLPLAHAIGMDPI
jgi:TRAP-type C4-dicarboxylate transport system permease large subunit